jgi:hypothetical protein
MLEHFLTFCQHHTLKIAARTLNDVQILMKKIINLKTPVSSSFFFVYILSSYIFLDFGFKRDNESLLQGQTVLFRILHFVF